MVQNENIILIFFYGESSSIAFCTQILLSFFRFLDYCVKCQILQRQIVENEYSRPKVKELLYEIEFPEPETEPLFHWNRCLHSDSLENLPRAIHHREVKVASVCATLGGICNLLRKGFNCFFEIQIFITKNACYVCNVVL